MPDEIKPALTAEEWERREFVRRYKDGDRMVRADTDEGGSLNIEVGCGDFDYEWAPIPDAARHPLAAMLLHGQPYGFTREDVATLRDAAAPASDWYREDDRLMRLADRIAALLPPEEP